MKTKKDLRIPYTWEERQPVYLDRFFYVPKAYAHGTWDGTFAWQGKGPVHLELCSGNGQWIGEQAQKRPDVQWVALEMQFDRARKIWLKLHRENIPNLYVVCAEGLAFLQHYAPARSVHQAFVNFPDPWPKRHHAKHRLVRPPFAEALAQAMLPGGSLMLATDDVPYRDQMATVFGSAAGWTFVPPSTDAGTYGASFFATLWQQKGKTLHYLQYLYDL